MYYNRYNEGALMEVNGLTAGFNMPNALTGESLHSLPPYALQPVYSVDDYECPPDWEHGSAKASSYFVGVEEGKGMWFDFTGNQNHKHHVAVVISVQGVNPITGPLKPGQIAELRLEQYLEKCPRHDVEFKSNRLCPECGYNWPKQNYLATTTGQYLWLDGFRNEKGEVRQYVLTADECRGVASQLIDKKRVYAIGFAFYLPKQEKPQPPAAKLCRTGGIGGQSGGGGYVTTCAMPQNSVEFADSSDLYSLASQEDAGSHRGIVRAKSKAKKLEVGKGARIQQEVGTDPNNLDFWQDEPAGLIYVNYLPMDVCQEMLKHKKERKKDGFLTGLQSAVN